MHECGRYDVLLGRLGAELLQRQGRDWIWSRPSRRGVSRFWPTHRRPRFAADCNQASGTYTTGAKNALMITLGPARAAACGAGSRSEEFLKLLGTATSYQLSGDQLFIILVPGTPPFALVFEKE